MPANIKQKSWDPATGASGPCFEVAVATCDEIAAAFTGVLNQPEIQNAMLHGLMVSCDDIALYYPIAVDEAASALVNKLPEILRHAVLHKSQLARRD